MFRCGTVGSTDSGGQPTKTYLVFSDLFRKNNDIASWFENLIFLWKILQTL